MDGLERTVISRKEFLRFLEPVPPLTPEGYLDWLEKMSHLHVFWTRKGSYVNYLGIKDGRGVVAAGITRRVGRRREKVELKEIYLKRSEYLRFLIDMIEEGPLEMVEWRYMDALLNLGFGPVRRSVLIGWRTDLNMKGNPGVRFKLVDDGRLAEEIQLDSWGFFIPPSPKRQKILIGFIGERPVCSAYLNHTTGNIDFGIHVKKEFRRRGIGTACLAFSLRYFRKSGFRWAYVVRALRSLYRVNEADRVALNFYLSRKGKLLRDFLLYKKKDRPKAPISISAYLRKGLHF